MRVASMLPTPLGVTNLTYAGQSGATEARALTLTKCFLYTRLPKLYFLSTKTYRSNVCSPSYDNISSIARILEVMSEVSGS